MAFLLPKPQQLQSLQPKDYNVIIVVCGTRHYKDRKQFHNELVKYLDNFNEPVLFVSGAAKSGADDLIIRWCLKYKYPCLEIPANWDKYGKSAGYIRNAEMVNIATHVLAFYDGKSPGTKHMLTLALEEEKEQKTILIKGLSNEPEDHKKTLRVILKDLAMSQKIIKRLYESS